MKKITLWVGVNFKTFVIMKKLENVQMEVVKGGDWRTMAGIVCAGGIGALAFSSALITMGASIPAVALAGSIGINACIAGILGSVYM